ncbi:Malolactic regulator [Lacticaseibacillus zeae]|uniref:Malolactic regulator n=1 Tax=Lacticaseibacillus zeae TaxID=57037 RepID=A0A5R8M099_LACZE|nr:Malolactic regulator [Lacticaseibacillus zeae]
MRQLAVRVIRGRRSDFGWTALTRSPAQKPACKDLGRNGLNPGHHARGHLHSGF